MFGPELVFNLLTGIINMGIAQPWQSFTASDARVNTDGANLIQIKPLTYKGTVVMNGVYYGAMLAASLHVAPLGLR